MAPEWWDGRGGTAASDMWSVGVVLFELLALKLGDFRETGA